MRPGTPLPHSNPPPSVSAQYESLRAAALGASLPPEARYGLTLFLRRGMWGWCQELAKAEAPPARARPRSPETVAPHHRAVIQILADLVLNAADTRTP